MNKLQKIIRRVVETFKIYLPIKKKTHTSKDVIISLTSYPARFKNLHIVIRSLLHQSVRAEKIVLYLGKDSNGISLPKRLLKLQKFNFIIKYDEDTKSFTKCNTGWKYGGGTITGSVIHNLVGDTMQAPKLLEKNYNQLTLEQYTLQEKLNVLNREKIIYERMLKLSKKK